MAPLLIPIVSMLAEKGMSAVSKLIDGGADKAIDLISEKTGIDLSKPEAVTTMTPEQEKALREYDLQLKMLDFDKEKAYLADVADARDMQKEALKQEDIFSKRFIYYFATGWSLFSGLYIGAITFYTIPVASVRFADTILGFLLGTIMAGMFAYFFGSSKGSKEKTDMMMSAIQNKG
jgi:hypothetical protein